MIKRYFKKVITDYFKKVIKLTTMTTKQSRKFPIANRFFFYFLLRSDSELLVSEIQKSGDTDFVSEIKGVEKYHDFEKIGLRNLARFTGFVVKISKMSKQRQTILVIF